VILEDHPTYLKFAKYSDIILQFNSDNIAIVSFDFY
jgi:hypothetical protein